MHLYEWSVFFLGSCSLVCMIGLVSPRYRDNLPMCIGMCLLAIGTASRVVDLADTSPVIPWDWFFVHAGIGLFALGKFFDEIIRQRRVSLVAFAHSTFDRMHRHPRIQAHVAPNSAAEKHTIL